MNAELGMRKAEKKDGETGGTRDGVRGRLEDRKVGRRGGESEGGIGNVASGLSEL